MSKVTAWLQSIDPDVAELISSLGTVEYFKVGEVVIQRGAMDNHLFLIEQGALSVQMPQGLNIELGPGEAVGEIAFFHNTPRSNNIIAQTSVRLRKINRVELMTRLLDNPSRLKNVLDDLAQVQQSRTHEAVKQEGPKEFVARLSEEALRHRAVNHKYLRALAEGDFPDLRWALKDFATNYYPYSAHFPRYLTTVISKLTQPEHRAALLENLTEETGVYEADELEQLQAIGIDPTWIVGYAHPILFQRFANALNAKTHLEADQVLAWRELFLSTLKSGSTAEALGALGIGTENIVSTIYLSFVEAIKRVDDLDPYDTVFFPLHTTVDDHHQETLQQISADFAGDEQGRHELRKGMLKALQLRASFWDWLYERALNPHRADQIL